MPFSFVPYPRLKWRDGFNNIKSYQYIESTGIFNVDCNGGRVIQGNVNNGEWTPILIAPPDGYRISYYTLNGSGRGFRGEYEGDFAVPFFAQNGSTADLGIQDLVLVWEKISDTSQKIEEHIKFNFFNYTVPENRWEIPSAEAISLSRDLSGSGINFEYYPETGYYSVTFDANKVPSGDDFTTEILLKAPQGAAYYSWNNHSGTTLVDQGVIAGQASVMDSIEKESMSKLSVDGYFSAPLIFYEQYDLNGLTAYYNSNKNIVGYIVEWYDESEVRIGSDFIYGTIDQFINEITTESVKDAAQLGGSGVDNPTVVIPGNKTYHMTCSIYPSNDRSELNQMFFELSLDEIDNGFKRDVYLPYRFIGVESYENAIERNLPAPTIRHYSDSMDSYEELIGELTTAGIRFVVNSFSPFTITANYSDVAEVNTKGMTGNVMVCVAQYSENGQFLGMEDEVVDVTGKDKVYVPYVKVPGASSVKTILCDSSFKPLQ